MVQLSDGEKFENVFSCFDTILACDRQMDGRTETNVCDNIVHAMLSIAR